MNSETQNNAPEYTPYSKTVDLNKIAQSLCGDGQHNLRIEPSSREAKCTKCAFGFRFLPQNIQLQGESVVVNSQVIGKLSK